MLGYRGDIVAGSKLYFAFNTRDASGNPITLAGSPAIKAYKQNSITACTTNPTLTVDYNSQTGRHMVVVDTSLDATFYASGNDFYVELTAGTVNGVSVIGAEVGSFSIGNRTASPSVAQIRTEMDSNSTKLANLDATVSSRLATSGYTAPTTPPTVAAIRTEMDTNSTKLANLDATVSSRLASSAYTAPPTVTAIQSGLALHSDVTTVEATLSTIQGLVGGGSGGTIVVSSFTSNALLALRANLTGAVVTVTGPVTYQPGCGLTLRLVIGDDYSATDSRQITFDLDGTVLPDLTTASVALVCELSGRIRSQVVISGGITVPTGTTRVVVFQPAAADTLKLSPTVDGEFAVVITLASGRVISPLEARGQLMVLMGQRPVYSNQ